MTELLVRWRTKIDWYDFNDWNYTDTWRFNDTDTNGVVKANISGLGNMSKDGIIKKGARYKIKFNISNYISGALKFTIGGFTSVNYFDNGSYEFVTDVTTDTNIIIDAITIVSSVSPEFSIDNLVIEDLNYSSLDLYKETQIALNFSISDIRDYSKRKGTFSKTIQIPGTKKNNNFFRNIFQINEDNSFNMNIKCSSTMMKDSISFVDGYLTLEEIILQDDKVLYSVGFFGDQLNLFQDIGEDKLEDLDLSGLDHIANYQNIINQANFPETGHNAWVHPYIDYGAEYGSIGGCVGRATDKSPSVGVTTSDLLPAVSVKWLIDCIFRNYGYSYSSSLFDSVDFSRLILPYVNDVELMYQWYQVSDVLYKGTTNITTWSVPPLNYLGEVYFNLVNTGEYYNKWMRCDRDGIPSYYDADQGYTSIWLDENVDVGGNSLELYRRFNYGPYTYSNITPQTPLQGQANEYNPNKYQSHKNHIPGSYLVRKSGKYKIEMRYDYLGSVRPFYVFACKVNTDDCEFDYSTTGTENHWRIPAAGDYSLPTNTPEEVHKLYTHGPSSSHMFSKYVSYEFDCDVGDQLYFKFLPHSSSFAVPDFKINARQMKVYEYGYGEGCNVEGKHMVPQDVKVRDFLKDLMTMFNLYIDVDPTDTKKLIIETRSDYYSSGSTLDWTQKLDLGNDISLTNPKDFQNYINKIEYKRDKDYTSELYNEELDIQDVGYGGKRFIINSDFATGEKSTKLSVFASTPLRDTWGVYGVSGLTQFITSRMWDCDYPSDPVSYEYKTNWLPRILIYNPLLINDNDNESRTWNFAGRTTHTSGYGFDWNYKYPYCGHVLNPFDQNNSSEFDINFDTKLVTGNVWQLLFSSGSGSVTKRNLWNLYYKNQFDQLLDKDSRIMEAYFKLDINDIKDLSLADNIFVNGTYFTINKIIDFNPDGKTLTKVELLKIIDGVDIEFDNYEEGNGSIPFSPIKPGHIGLIQGRENYKRRNTTGLIIGEGNIDLSENSIIIGDGNFVDERSALIGSNNVRVASGSTATILNSDNVSVESGHTNVTVIGTNNLTIDENDILYINDIKIKDGNILAANGLIDGGDIGVDGVFNPFKFHNYHINSSGENGNDDFDINVWEIEDGGNI